MSGSTIMIHIGDGERVQGEVRVLRPMSNEPAAAEPLLELTFQVGHRERVSLLWRGKGAIGSAASLLVGMLGGVQGLREEQEAQEVREQEAEATPGEAQEGPQAPLAASEGHGRAGGGEVGALEGSESPSGGIVASPAPAPGEPQSPARHYSWTGTDRECPDCGGLRPLWHEPDCHTGALRKAREVAE